MLALWGPPFLRSEGLRGTLCMCNYWRADLVVGSGVGSLSVVGWGEDVTVEANRIQHATGRPADAFPMVPHQLVANNVIQSQYLCHLGLCGHRHIARNLHRARHCASRGSRDTERCHCSKGFPERATSYWGSRSYWVAVGRH